MRFSVTLLTLTLAGCGSTTLYRDSNSDLQFVQSLEKVVVLDPEDAAGATNSGYLDNYLKGELDSGLTDVEVIGSNDLFRRFVSYLDRSSLESKTVGPEQLSIFARRDEAIGAYLSTKVNRSEHDDEDDIWILSGSFQLTDIGSGGTKYTQVFEVRGEDEREAARRLASYVVAALVSAEFPIDAEFCTPDPGDREEPSTTEPQG